VEFSVDGRTPQVAIVGFGYVGSTIAAVLTDRRLKVIGIDVDETLISEMRNGYCRFNEPGLAEALDRARKSGRLTLSADYASLRNADVVIITVGTPIDTDRSLVTRYLEAVCTSLTPVLRRGQLVILKSTVAPGITDGFVRPMLEKGGLVQGRDFWLAFCPERLAEGAALAQFSALPIVIGGCGENSAEAARRFWARALDVPLDIFDRPEVAELIKLADNTWIDLNIALGNELARLCGALDVDVLDVIAGANALPKGQSNVNILLPSVGVGGSCLTKDPWVLWTLGRERGVRMRLAETAREVNDAMPGYVHELIRRGLSELGKDSSTAKVAVLGLAYKNNTNDLRHTPVLPVVEALRAGGTRVALYDPLVTAEAVEAEFGLVPSPSLAAAVRDSDCVAVLAAHDQLRDLDFAGLARLVSMPCLLLDGRAYYSKQTITSLTEAGFAYLGVGR
jgi:UDP-N-acetyl-D-mannosaminuronic acid dehydrogenase